MLSNLGAPAEERILWLYSLVLPLDNAVKNSKDIMVTIIRYIKII